MSQSLGTNPMNGLRDKKAYNATWVYKTVADSKIRPKDHAIECGKKLGHTLFFERQEGKANYRCYGSYASLEDFSQALGTNNAHFYEIIPEHISPRFYMDIDGETDCLDEVLDIVCSGFQEEFGIAVTKDDFGISTANGISDFGGKKNIMKYSAHIVCYKHEIVFKSKKDILYFLTKYHHPAVDTAVYSKNQSFKTIYQSKYGSDRIQTPLSGGYCEHLVTYHTDLPKKLLSCKRVVKDIDTRHKNQALLIHQIGVKCPENPAFPKDTFDKHSVRDLLELLPNSGEYEQPYKTWFCVLCICKNENEPVDTFLNWSRQYRGHNDDDVLKKFHETEYKSDGYTIKMLQNLVSKVNPMVFKNYDDKFVHQICYPTLDFEQHKIHYEMFDARYLPNLSKYFGPFYKHVVVKSYLGTGKSTQNNAIIKELNPETILVVSPRILFSYSIVGNIRKVCPDMRIYRELDKAERPKYPYMACQVESLHTIGSRYDLVIIDESESVLNQFSSETNEKHFKDNVRQFDTIIKNARYVVWSDAFVTDRTLATVHHFADDKPFMYVHNTWKPTNRKRVYVGNDWTCLSKYIKYNLSNARTVTISSNTALVQDLKDSLPNIFALYAGCDDEIKYKLTDPDKAVEGKQHVAHTNALNVGTDIQVKFDYRCVYLGANSAVVRDLFQAMERVRNFTKEETFYSLYPRYHGKKATDVFDRTRIDAILMKKNGHDTLFETYPWIRKVCVMNIQEQNVSAKCFSKVCEEYFHNCGYVKANIQKNNETDHELAMFDTDRDGEFDEIPDVDLETYSAYYLNIQCGRASEAEKQMVLKYHFKNFIIRNTDTMDPETVKCVWNGFLSNKQRMIDKVCNLKYEIGDEQDPVSSDPLFNNRENKLKHIKDICASLGIQNSYTRANIERSLVEATCEKILQIKTEIKEQFGIPLEDKGNAGKATTLKRGIQLLNAVLERWGFTKIQVGKRQRTRVDGGRIDTTPYTIEYETHGDLITGCVAGGP